MGIAQVPSPGSQGMGMPEGVPTNLSRVEERMLADELRALQVRRTATMTPIHRPSASEAAVRPSHAPTEPEIEELTADDLMLEEAEYAPAAARATATSRDTNRLRIDEFDD